MNYRTRRGVFFGVTSNHVPIRDESASGSAGRKKAASALVCLMTLTGECGSDLADKPRPMIGKVVRWRLE